MVFYNLSNILNELNGRLPKDLQGGSFRHDDKNIRRLHFGNEANQPFIGVIISIKPLQWLGPDRQ